MPSQLAKSGFLSKLTPETRVYFEEHKSDPAEYSSFGDLPGGIEGGIAQLVDCKFDTYKKGDFVGEYFFYAAGVVLSPKEHAGIRIEGLRTSIMEPMHDTPTRSRQTQQDHLGWVVNEFKKLGVDTSNIQIEDIEEVAATIKAAQPYFTFRTWKGDATKEYPNPKTNHQWGGQCEYNGETDSAAGVVDESPRAAPATTTTDRIKSQSQGNGKPQTRKSKSHHQPIPEPKPAPETKSGSAFSEFGDLVSLVKSADSGDKKAMTTLTELAEKAGVAGDDINNASDWAEVAKLISTVGSSNQKKGETTDAEDETEAPTEPIEWGPQVGEVYLYRPLDKATKRPVEKPIECEVMGVADDRRTVNLKNLDNTKISYTGVKWEALEGRDS